MSTMNGNPHYTKAEWSIEHNASCDEVRERLDRNAQIEATMALAYEQRTANLMQFLVDQEGDEARKLWAQVAARLGLNGATS